MLPDQELRFDYEKAGKRGAGGVREGVPREAAKSKKVRQIAE